jgi:hypothetical protein
MVGWFRIATGYQVVILDMLKFQELSDSEIQLKRICMHHGMAHWHKPARSSLSFNICGEEI